MPPSEVSTTITKKCFSRGEKSEIFYVDTGGCKYRARFTHFFNSLFILGYKQKSKYLQLEVLKRKSNFAQ